MRDTKELARRGASTTVRAVLIDLTVQTQDPKTGKLRILHEVRGDGRAVTSVYIAAKGGGTISPTLSRFWDDEVRLKFNEELSRKPRRRKDAMYRKVKIDDESVIVMEVEGYSEDTVRRHVAAMLRRYDELRLECSDEKLVRKIERIDEKLGLDLDEVRRERWREIHIHGGASEQYSFPDGRG